MLSEGWDAKTVTHIMGLRAFSSQLLCEQVVGRGLRRTTYDVNPDTGLFEPEYVNIFGVPFTFLPHEGGHDNPPPPPKPKIAIEPVPDREVFEISWPNVIRVEHTLRPEPVRKLGKTGPTQLGCHKDYKNSRAGSHCGRQTRYNQDQVDWLKAFRKWDAHAANHF